MRSPLSSVRCPSNRLSASTWHNGCTPTKSSVHPYDIVLQYFLLIAAYRPPAASVSVRQKFDNLSDDLCLSVKHSLIVIGAQHQPNSILHLYTIHKPKSMVLLSTIDAAGLPPTSPFCFPLSAYIARRIFSFIHVVHHDDDFNHQ